MDDGNGMEKTWGRGVNVLPISHVPIRFDIDDEEDED